MKQRNVAYDLMKGIALILMMYDHLVKTPDGVHQFIYSFHMPLFFYLSGSTFSLSKNNYGIKYGVAKRMRSLLIPYFLFSVISFFYFILKRCQFVQTIQFQWFLI